MEPTSEQWISWTSGIIDGEGCIGIYRRSLKRPDEFRLVVRVENTDPRMLIRLKEPAVIATGGGAPCYLDGMDLMNKSGHTIFLNPPLDEAIERVKKEKNQRPLVSGPEESIQNKMKDLYEKRLPCYQKASFTTNNGLEAIERHLSSI